jgi:diguanylate cyclase (GGDEF)-like protein
MWGTVLDGEKWTGIMKNIAKDGSTYWLKTHITPELKGKSIIGFTAISQNITDQKNMEEMSIKDELTQAYNRRYFNQIFPKELKRARRNEDIYCIAMLDIDYFKKYNDTYGHLKGDEALQKVVSTVSKKLQRPGDYLFRVGGEEFIIMYSDIKSHNEAKEFSLALVKAVEDINIEHKSSESSNVLTISLGLLTITPPCFMDEKAILQRIDELLYKAKDGGRNQMMSEEC